MKTTVLPVQFIHDINAKENTNTKDNIERWICQVPIDSINNIDTYENLRSYLADVKGKAKTGVHKAIEETLINNIEYFSLLNGGIVITAEKCLIHTRNDGCKIIKLRNASIINGAQTQGSIGEVLSSDQADFIDNYGDYHILTEIIISDTPGLAAEIACSRNYQNNVSNISMVGKKGKLDELEKNIQYYDSSLKLRKSETDTDDEEFINTEKLLQVIAALTPINMMKTIGNKRNDYNKTFTYNQKAKCLKLFENIWGMNNVGDKSIKSIYQFYLDIAYDAYRLYNHWKVNQKFSGTKIHSIEKEKNGKVKNVPDGIVFPIISAYTTFVEQIRFKGKIRWRICTPENFNELFLIKSAKTSYTDIAKSNPNLMGKSKSCYSSLQSVTEMYNQMHDLG